MIRKVVEFNGEEEYLDLIKGLVHRAYEMCARDMKDVFVVLKAAEKLFQAEDVEVKIE